MYFTLIFKDHVECEYEPSGIERLLDKIFENYNLMVRPENSNKETIIHTELKVLQIDLVSAWAFKISSPLKLN